ncbi:MAG: hypothetical protein GZ088_17290 [Acidipila sp.]|nr:hypothetical protein [Acidipila sp.]
MFEGYGVMARQLKNWQKNPTNLRLFAGLRTIRVSGEYDSVSSFRGCPVPDYEWRELYRMAVIEVDPALLKKSIEAAEAAILRRLEILARQPDSSRERRAIAEALSNLGVLKSDTRNWPPQDHTASLTS